MAGGYGSGAGVPLSERVRVDARQPVGQSPAAHVGGRHCWVTSFGNQKLRAAGLLLEWRHQTAPANWEARVVFSLEKDPGRWVSVEAWLPSAAVEPLAANPTESAGPTLSPPP